MLLLLVAEMNHCYRKGDPQLQLPEWVRGDPAWASHPGLWGPRGNTGSGVRIPSLKAAGKQLTGRHRHVHLCASFVKCNHDETSA